MLMAKLGRLIYSGRLQTNFTWAHNITEHAPDQLKYPLITTLPPLAFKVDTRYDECITSSSEAPVCLVKSRW